MYHPKREKNFVPKYIVLFLLVCVIWLIQKLNQIQEVPWEISLVLEVQQGDQWTERDRVSIDLSLQGSGWKILSAQRKGLPKQLHYKVPPSEWEKISETSIKAIVSEALKPFGLFAHTHVPTSIGLNLENLAKKEVRVIQPMHISYRKGYGSFFTATYRDTLISLLGLKDHLPLEDTLVLDTLYFHDLKEDIYFQHSWENLFEKTQWESNPPWSIRLKVEKFTDKIITLEPEIRGLSKDKRARTIPKSISLQCSVPLGLYEKITKEDFEAWIDLDSTLLYGKDRIGLVKVNSKSFPLLKSKIYPSQVKVLVYEKQ
jgi:hypothetical protein